MPPVGGAPRILIFFFAGSVVGAALLGAVLGAFGQVLQGSGSAGVTIARAVAIVSAIYGLAELIGRPLRVPSSNWRVPARWALYGPRRYSLLFGFMLGLGVATVVPFVGFFVLLAICVLLASPVAAAAIMALFGIVRGLPLLLARSVCASRGVLSVSEANGFALRLSAVSATRWMALWRGVLLCAVTMTVWR